MREYIAEEAGKKYLYMSESPENESNFFMLINENTFTDEDREVLGFTNELDSNLKPIKSSGYADYQKKEKINQFKKLEKRAIELRTEYITAELLPEGTLKDKKLSKIFNEGEETKAEFDSFVAGLISEYGEGILDEII